MKILVFIKEEIDTKILLEFDENTKRVRREGVIPQLGPAGLMALETALKIKESLPQTHLSLIHLGPSSGVEWIRLGLSLGFDEGLRVWEAGLEELKAPAKALIFARVAQILGFDLILTGSRSSDTDSGEIGIRMAVHLDVPSVISVSDLEINGANGSVRITKNLARGFKEEIHSSLPLLVALEGSEYVKKQASFTALLQARGKQIPCWDLAFIGLSRQSIREKDDLLCSGPLSFPRPRLRRIPAPDSSLPTFERILKLLEGTIQSREGRIIKADEDRMVEEIFQIFLKEEWLKPLHPKS